MFRLLLCLFVAVAIGLRCGGWTSLKLQNAGNATGATTSLRRGAWTSAASVLLLLAVVFGWPFKRESVSTFDEIVESVVVPEEEVVNTSRYFFWRTTTVETKDVTKTVTRQVPVTHVRRSFSIWLLAFEALVAFVAYKLQLWTCALLWRHLPRRFLTRG